MFPLGCAGTGTRIRAENSPISSNKNISPWFRTVFKQESFYSALNYSSILIQDGGKAHVNERSGHKLKHRRFCLNTRKTFFTVQVAKHWHRSLREDVEPYLELFRSHLSVAKGSLPQVALLEQGVGPGGFQRFLPTSAGLWICGFVTPQSEFYNK